VEAVEADQLARVVDREVAFERRLGSLRTGRAGVPGDQRQAADPTRQTVAAEDPPDPLGDTTMPPQRSWANVALMRRGPRPGCPRLKAKIRPSTS